MSDLETIKSLAAKLAALAAPGSGATDSERAVALAKLESLLKRNGLSLEDLGKEDVIPLWVKVKNKGERELFHACTFFITGASTISVSRRVGKPRDAAVHVTAVQAVDIRACFSHYVKILRAKVHQLREEIKQAKAAIRIAHEAVIVRYDITARPPEDEGGPLGPEQLEAIHRAAEAEKVRVPSMEEMEAFHRASSGLSGDAWVKPAGKVGIQKAIACAVEVPPKAQFSFFDEL